MQPQELEIPIDELIHPLRVDIPARIEVLELYEKHGRDYDFSQTAWYKFRGQEGIDTLLDIYNHIRRLSSYPLIGVGGNRTLMDGAHRVAILKFMGVQTVHCTVIKEWFTVPDFIDRMSKDD